MQHSEPVVALEHSISDQNKWVQIQRQKQNKTHQNRLDIVYK